MGLGAAIWGISACEHPRARIYEERLTGISPPARHAVHSDRLSSVMSAMQREVVKTWPQEIEDEMRADAERRQERAFETARQLARALSDVAEAIPDAIAEVEMSEEDHLAFLHSTEMLRRQANRLESDSIRKDISGMQNTLDMIQTTCYGCHTQFCAETGALRFGM